MPKYRIRRERKPVASGPEVTMEDVPVTRSVTVGDVRIGVDDEVELEAKDAKTAVDADKKALLEEVKNVEK